MNIPQERCFLCQLSRLNQTNLAMFVLRCNCALFVLLGVLYLFIVDGPNLGQLHPANLRLYVCEQTPLLLEVNTSRSKLRDFIEKIVKAKLGMSFPLVMHGSTLLYEVGDDLEEDMVANYEANLEKVSMVHVIILYCLGLLWFGN